MGLPPAQKLVPQNRGLISNQTGLNAQA